MSERTVCRGFGVALGIVLCVGSAGAQLRFPAQTWDVAPPPDPAAMGWSTQRLAEARGFSESIGSTAVMIVQRGIVVAQWGDVARRGDVFSVRKSLLSALIGRAVDGGRLDTAASLGKLGIDDAPPLTEAEKAARVVDLLTSRSGVYHPAVYETPAMMAQRPARGSHAPGTFFYYNNWDFNALGTIYERAAKRSVFEAFLEDIAKPVGMEDLRREDMAYFRDTHSQHPAYLFRMSARDLARFGLLYLAGGEWNGRTIVSRPWMRWSTSALADQGIRGGYGALWWVATDPNDPVITVPVGSFSARGTGEQNLFVFPQQQLVVVHRGDPETRLIRVQQFGRLLRMILGAAQGAEAPDSLLLAIVRRVLELDIRRQLPTGTPATIDSLLSHYSDSVVYEHPGVGAVIRGKTTLRAGMLRYIGSVAVAPSETPRITIGAGVAVVETAARADPRAPTRPVPATRRGVRVLEFDADRRIRRIIDYPW